jgi:hypothetical protein
MTLPEIDLLLSCCRTQIDSSTEDRIRLLLQQGIDWTYVNQISALHRVMPILYWNLKSTCPELVPGVVLSQLQNHYEANALLNLILSKELVRLLNRFDECGIPAIPFKGPILASSLYSNIALRQFGDLDILINSKDKMQARELLVTDQYQLESDYGWQQTFDHRHEPLIQVDLHWQLTPSKFPFKFHDFETLWNRCSLSNLCGETVITFSSNDLLIILAVQVARGGFEDKPFLAQICDLSQLISSTNNLEWEKILHDVTDLGLGRPFFLGLLLVSNLLKTHMPTQVEELIKQRIKIDPFISYYCLHIQERLFSKNRTPFIISSALQRRFLRDSPTEKLHYFGLLWDCLAVIAVLVTSISEQDRKFLPLPSFFSFLYLLIRPIRLLMKYSSVELSLVCESSKKVRYLLQQRPRC